MILMKSYIVIITLNHAQNYDLPIPLEQVFSQQPTNLNLKLGKFKCSSTMELTKTKMKQYKMSWAHIIKNIKWDKNIIYQWEIIQCANIYISTNTASKNLV
jgi:hypothetical protein